MATVSYDKNTDYQALIDQAAKQGDYYSASQYEKMRNAKIEDLNAAGTNIYNAQTTNKYAGYDTGAYVPLNTTNAQLVNPTGYQQQAQAAQQYVNSNPTVTQKYTQQEIADRYGTLTGIAKENRVAQQGTSGADEKLLNDEAYAAVQYEKQVYAQAQQEYTAAKRQLEAAQAAGDSAGAAAAQAAMDAAQKEMDTSHLNAERWRMTGSWLGGYSGGADGSMYIPGLDTGSTSHSGSGGGGYGSSGYGSASGGSYGSGSGGVTDLSSWLEQMYAAQKAAALAELEAAYQSNLAALDRAETGLGESYQDARNQTAGASELAKRNFSEYAAANGLNSGTGGQAELARNVTLQNNMNDLNSAEASSVADLELQRSNAEIEYNNAIAQAEAQGNYELAAALYQEKVRVQNALIEQQMQQEQIALQREQMALSNSQFNANLAANQSQFNSNLAFQQQQYADSLALQQQQTQAALEQAQLEQAAKEQEDYYNLYGKVYGNEALFNLLYGSPAQQLYQSAYNSGYSSPTVSETTAPSVGTTSGSGMNADTFGRMSASLSATLAQGGGQSAINGTLSTLDSVWSTLSDTQKAQIRQLLSRYGYDYEA